MEVLQCSLKDRKAEARLGIQRELVNEVVEEIELSEEVQVGGVDNNKDHDENELVRSPKRTGNKTKGQ